MTPESLPVVHSMPGCPATITGRHGGGPCLCSAEWVHHFEPRDVAPAEDAVFKDRAKGGRRLLRSKFI